MAELMIIGLSAVALIVFYMSIRKQEFVADKQFLKSMIPHHPGATVACENANIQDPEIKKLGEGKTASQQREIAQMKAKLK